MVKQKRILLTSAGGPATENVIGNFILANDGTWLVGCDTDEDMLRLSSAYRTYVVHSAYDVKKYISDLNNIIKKEKITMLYPQSDLEVAVVSANRDYFKAPVCLPNNSVIEICQNKKMLYIQLISQGIKIPESKFPTSQDIRMLCLSDSPNYGVGIGWNYPYWIRATHGAGGTKAFLANSWKEFRLMAQYYKAKGEEVEWLVSKYLGGDDYSWTSLWNKGELITSVLKKRIKWVYNRIGTTAIQETVVNQQVNFYCESIIKALNPHNLDPQFRGIMMIDLKQDLDDKQFYVTEVNAGRLGTVNLFYGWASREIYRDRRINFPWLLAKLCHGEELPDLKRFDALPEGLVWIRHLDMGFLLMDRNKTQPLNRASDIR